MKEPTTKELAILAVTWACQFVSCLIIAIAVCLFVTAAIGGTPVGEVIEILHNLIDV